jgi:rubredoxin
MKCKLCEVEFDSTNGRMFCSNPCRTAMNRMSVEVKQQQEAEAWKQLPEDSKTHLLELARKKIMRDLEEDEE